MLYSKSQKRICDRHSRWGNRVCLSATLEKEKRAVGGEIVGVRGEAGVNGTVVSAIVANLSKS
jgi:hypothetical protein